jgi:hypothetical protein
MRAALTVLLLVAASLSFSFALLNSPAPEGPLRSAAEPPLPPGPPTPLRWESRYDSVRTDLADYLWPTDAGRALTSTFGEFRRTHFHAGIDVSTGDRTGFKVFASRGGYVWRIGVSPDGYGKVLYLRHRDGYTTVYAHLDRFSKDLDARVRADQERLERYPVDITFAPGEVPVAKGDVVAFTGETGAGSPHLHFEIRDEHMNAVNPLLCPSFEVADDITPEPNAIALLPIGPGSRVDGMNVPSMRRLARDPSGAAAARTGFRLTGDAGVAINVRDRSNKTWYRHGVYRHTLRIDDSVAFDVRIDRVPVNEGQQISLYYSWPMLRSGKGRYEKLFVDGWHELPFLSNAAIGGGVVSSFSLSPGTHTVAVRSEDIRGNAVETVARVEIIPPAGLPLTGRSGLGGTDGTPAAPLDVDLSLSGEFIHVTAAALGAFSTRPVLTVREGPLSRTLPMELVSGSRAAATFAPDPAHQGVRTMSVEAEVAGVAARGEASRAVYAVEPFTNGAFTVDGGALTVRFEPGSTFGPLAMTVDPSIHNGQTVYSFGPEDAVLKNGLAVTVRPRVAATRLALYVGARDRWTKIRTEAMPDGTLRGRMRRTLGDLTVLSDTTAPAIGRVRVQQRPGRKLLVSFGFDDNLSGVDYDTMKLYLDGRFRVPEIDGEHHRAVFLSAEPLSVGPHRVTISFSDELGNTTSVERTITIR